MYNNQEFLQLRLWVRERAESNIWWWSVLFFSISGCDPKLILAPFKSWRRLSHVVFALISTLVFYLYIYFRRHNLLFLIQGSKTNSWDRRHLVQTWLPNGILMGVHVGYLSVQFPSWGSLLIYNAPHRFDKPDRLRQNYTFAIIALCSFMWPFLLPSRKLKSNWLLFIDAPSIDCGPIR